MNQKNILNRNMLSPEEAYVTRKINQAKYGLVFSLITAVAVVVVGIFNSASIELINMGTKDNALVTIIMAVTILAIVDLLVGIIITGYNFATGRGFREYKRMLKLKISWMMLLSALVSGPLATGCALTAANFCGITYSTVVLSLTPILTAFAARIFFKENINSRMFFGIVIALVGAIIASWIKPEGVSNFYLGIALAACAPIGYVIEGMASTYAADIIDPMVGVGFYRSICSGILGIIIVIIVTAFYGNTSILWTVISSIFTNHKILFYMMIMAIFASLDYVGAYQAFNKCGPTRAGAVIYTMPVWSIPIGMMLAAIGIYPYTVTITGIIGAVVVVIGLLFVIAKPSDLFNLREVDN